MRYVPRKQGEDGMTYEQAISFIMNRNGVTYAIAQHYVETVLGLSKEI